MQDAGADQACKEGTAAGESEEQQRGGQGEAGPGSQRARPARAEQADGEDDLAAGGARQGLRDGDELGVGIRAEPAAALDKLGMKVTEMRDGASEGEATETKEGGENFERRGRLGLGVDTRQSTPRANQRAARCRAISDSPLRR